MLPVVVHVLLFLALISTLATGDPKPASCLVLDAPFNKFDTNHWFHMSEFFLSKNSFVEESWGSTGREYVLLAPSQRFVTHLTKMTMFLLAAAFTDGTASVVQVAHSPGDRQALLRRCSPGGCGSDAHAGVGVCAGGVEVPTLGLRFQLRRAASDDTEPAVARASITSTLPTYSFEIPAHMLPQSPASAVTGDGSKPSHTVTPMMSWASISSTLIGMRQATGATSADHATTSTVHQHHVRCGDVHRTAVSGEKKPIVEWFSEPGSLHRVRRRVSNMCDSGGRPNNSSDVRRSYFPPFAVQMKHQNGVQKGSPERGDNGVSLEGSAEGLLRHGLLTHHSVVRLTREPLRGVGAGGDGGGVGRYSCAVEVQQLLTKSGESGASEGRSAPQPAASNEGHTRVKVQHRRLLVYQRNINRKIADVFSKLDELVDVLRERGEVCGVGSSVGTGAGAGAVDGSHVVYSERRSRLQQERLQGLQVKSTRGHQRHLSQPSLNRGSAWASAAPSVVEWTIDVLIHDDSTDPCVLREVMHAADVVLTPHGFQEIAILFMRPGATLIEVFPYKYFKPTYQLLARELGLRHHFIKNTFPHSVSSEVLRFAPTAEYCMKYLRCRGFARSDNVHLTVNDVGFVVDLMLLSSPP